MIQNTKATVVLTSTHILKKEFELLSKMPKEAMLLLKYDSRDSDFLHMLSQSSLKVMLVASTNSTPDEFGLCSSY